METQDLIHHSERLIDGIRKINEDDFGRFEGLLAQTKEFLRVYAGPKSKFFDALDKIDNTYYLNMRADTLANILDSFIDYINSGLQTGISPTRQAQIDIVSDYLEMSNRLLETKEVHPAAPAVLIGATLEEFLRTWVEIEGLSLGNRKPSIDAYANTLREAEFITKQDIKDITAWGGIRNHAAHGEWDEVSDKQRIRLMLEGINMFMRKYSR